ncbi:O-methyltransferase [Marinivivus vitaminiproducens]|uniref:O-methyltransferase n=1 Tax=Marinivivus vitaminiproducens TaxID=3035935 RepID=UPI00279ED75C|nr:class I SAM-dependent methyltransferase [Geminicoccaceae bacterium SCSIO 64248]
MLIKRVLNSLRGDPFGGVSSFDPQSTTRLAQMRNAILAVEADSFTTQERAWFARIEELREEMNASEEMLEAWDRPWLDESPEIREKLSIGASTRYETAISKAKACKASKSGRACRLLFALVRHTHPESVVEMGTNVGISGLYIAAALECNGSGRLVTMEGAPSKAALARDNFARAGLADRMTVVVGDFNDTLDGVIAAARPVDMAFIDGFHDGPATLRYHAMIKANAAQDAVLVYDDIRWSKGMQAAWQTLAAEPDTGTVIDLGPVGFWTRDQPGKVVRARYRL